MAKLVNWVKKFVREEEGPTMVEYALMVVLIAIVAMVAAATLGKQVNTVFQNIADALGA